MQLGPDPSAARSVLRAFAFAAVVAACAPPAPAGDAAVSRDDGSPADASPPPPDASPPDAPPAACNALDLASAPLVLPTATTGAPPAPTGGALADGVYVLDAVVYYFASPDHAELPFPRVRQLLEVRGGVIDRAAQSSLGAVTRSSATLRTAGSALYTTRVCPDAAPEQLEQYSATADALVLLVQDSASSSVHRYVPRR